MNIILLAPPAAGKGTQAELLDKKYHLNHISTGDLLRSAASREDDFGKKLKEIMASGALVSDEIVLELLEKHLEQSTNHNLLFDGFPRTIHQAELLDEMLEKKNDKIKQRNKDILLFNGSPATTSKTTKNELVNMHLLFEG